MQFYCASVLYICGEKEKLPCKDFYFLALLFNWLFICLNFSCLRSKWQWWKPRQGWRTIWGNWTRVSSSRVQAMLCTLFFLHSFAFLWSTFGLNSREDDNQLPPEKRICSKNQCHKGCLGHRLARESNYQILVNPPALEILRWCVWQAFVLIL